jgi:predicted MFS family arabinose efflux permease
LRKAASASGGGGGGTVTATAATTTTTAQTEDPRILTLIRILFLLYYGSLGALMPYLPVYYHSLGHGGQIIGVLGAVKPFTTFLVAPLWGLISDLLQKPFFILNMTFLVSAVGQVLVAFPSDAMYIIAMVFVTALFNAPVKSLLDSMVMDQLHDQSRYGRLRLWGQMGFGLGSSVTGWLLSRYKDRPWPTETTFSDGFEDRLAQYPMLIQHAAVYADKCWQSLSGYKLLFLAYAALSVPTFLGIQTFKRMSRHTTHPPALKKKESSPKKKEEQTTSTLEGFSMLLRNADALLFFFLVFVVGVSSGTIENFAYVRIREVGGTGKEMGLSRLVSSIAGAPMFWFSGPLARTFGVDRVLVLTLMSYVTRFIIYALMQRAYQGLPAEALRGVTFAAVWSSATIYAHKVSPAGLHTTMLMMMNAMYGGLGQSLGAIIGGRLQHRFGTVQTFWYAAAFDAIFVTCLILYLGLRKDSNFRNPRPIS